MELSQNIRTQDATSLRDKLDRAGEIGASAISGAAGGAFLGSAFGGGLVGGIIGSVIGFAVNAVISWVYPTRLARQGGRGQ